MPPTKAVSECSFSALKRIKTYPNPTTGDATLNHLAHASACPQGIGRWDWHDGGRQFVCCGQPVAQALVRKAFIKRHVDTSMNSAFASTASCILSFALVPPPPPPKSSFFPLATITIQYNTTLFYYPSHTQPNLVSRCGVGWHITNYATSVQRPSANQDNDGNEKRHQTKCLKSRAMAVHVRYKSLYISLPPSAKQQREMASSASCERR